MTANSEFSAGNRPPQHGDLVSTSTRRLAERTTVFLLAVIVLAVIIAVAVTGAVYWLQPVQTPSSGSP